MFEMDFGTFEISTFFGPIVDPRTPYLLPNYLKEYKKCAHIFEKYYFQVWESEHLRTFEISETLAAHFFNFEVLNLWNYEFLFFDN